MLAAGLLVSRHSDFPPTVSVREILGVRVPARDAAPKLVRVARPMAVASQERRDRLNGYRAGEVLADPGGRIDRACALRVLSTERESLCGSCVKDLWGLQS